MRIRTAFYLTCCLFITDSASTHEINVHKNITKAAVEFLARRDERFSCASTVAKLADLLLEGTEYEDNTYPGEWPLGRFFFHFSPVLKDGEFSADCSSLDWGLRANQDGSAQLYKAGTTIPRETSGVHLNEFRWQDALRNARDLNGGLSENGWTYLGYVIHLLEDLTSPAHTRNDSHPHLYGIGDADPVEYYNGRQNNTKGSMAEQPSAELLKLLKLESIGDVEKLFKSLETFTRTAFYSNNSILDPRFVDENGQIVGPKAIPGTTPVDPYFYGSCLPGLPCTQGRRKIAAKGTSILQTENGPVWARSDDLKFAYIDETVALEQFRELGPVAVAYVGALIRLYADVVSPAIPACTSPALIVIPRSHDFGQVSIGSFAEKRFTITNTGGAALTINTLNIVSQGEYRVTPDAHLPRSIEPGATLGFTTRWGI